MVTQRWAGGPFESVHADFIDDEAPAWASSAAVEHSPEERERGRRAFVLRALDEERSLAAFSALLGSLARERASVDVLGSLARVVRDEARHVDYCHRMVAALGGERGNEPAPSWVEISGKDSLRRQVLKTIVGSLAIGETLSVAMLAGVRAHASDPLAHDVLTRMLADESFHSRFGWWWLALEAPRLHDDEHEFLRAWIPRVLARLERDVRPPPSTRANPPPHRPSPFGSMSVAERDEAFRGCIVDRVLPGFARLGIDVQFVLEKGIA